MAGSQDEARTQARWWRDDYDDEGRNRKVRGQRLAGVAQALWRAQEPLRQEYRTAWRLYSQRNIAGLGPRMYRGAGRRGKPLGLNLCKAVTDAWHAQITKDIPLSKFDVTDGDRRLKQRAAALQSFVTGVKYGAKWDIKRDMIARDTGVFGQGIGKVCRSTDPKTGKTCIGLERRMPWLILCDEQEAMTGDPSSIYELKWVDRQELMDLYPQEASRIKVSSSSSFLETEAQAYVSANLVDWVVLVEGYHRPRVAGKDGSQDGRHTILVGDLVLEDEPHYWHRFPYEFNYGEPPIQGVYTEGIPNSISNIQFEINRVMLTLNRSQRAAVGHWFVEQNSDVNTNGIDNDAASIVTYTGVKPEYIANPSVPADVYAYLWALWEKGFEEKGLSLQASSSQVPQNLKSGEAISTYANVATERFTPQYRQYADWDRRITEQILHLAAEIAEDEPDLEVKSVKNPQARRRDQAIKWADAHLDESEYNLEIREINALGETVPEKIQTASDMTSAGLVDQDNAKRLLLEDGGMPDLTGYENLEASSAHYVEWCLSKALDDGEYVAPIAQLKSLPVAIAQMQQHYIVATMDEVPQDRLRLLRQWMDEAARLEAEIHPPPPPMPIAGPGMPPGGPVPHAPLPGGPLALASHLAPVAPPPQVEPF